MDQARLKYLLHYDPETGEFRWVRPTKPRIQVGSVAGCVNKLGYRYICIDGKKFLAHRLAWLYVHGEFPAGEIDHCNRIPSDNRIANLRVVTRSQNGQNRGKQANNQSGFKGVYRDQPTGKWRACIKLNGRNHHLGYFDSAKEAHAAYQAAAAWLHSHRPT